MLHCGMSDVKAERKPATLPDEAPRWAVSRGDGPEPPGVAAMGRRVTLGTVLLWTTLAALVLANGFTLRRLRRAEAERDALRAQLGHLTVRDDGQLAAVQVATTEPLLWQYRVQIPRRGDYRFSYGTVWPARAARPRWVSAMAMPAGESTLIVRIMQDPRDQVWKLVCILRQGEATVRQSTALQPRQTELFRTSTDTFRLGVGRETRAVDADQSLTLIDQRWFVGEAGLMMYGAGPPKADIDGVFGVLEADEGALNR